LHLSSVPANWATAPKSIVEAHGDSIGIEDAFPHGTRIVIRLPRNAPENGKGIDPLFVEPERTPDEHLD